MVSLLQKKIIAAKNSVRSGACLASASTGRPAALSSRNGRLCVPQLAADAGGNRGNVRTAALFSECVERGDEERASGVWTGGNAVPTEEAKAELAGSWGEERATKALRDARGGDLGSPDRRVEPRGGEERITRNLNVR